MRQERRNSKQDHKLDKNLQKRAKGERANARGLNGKRGNMGPQKAVIRESENTIERLKEKKQV